MEFEQLKQKKVTNGYASDLFPIYLKKILPRKKIFIWKDETSKNNTVIFINSSWSGGFHCKISYITGRRYVHI